MKSSIKNILITGGLGFIGLELTKYLLEQGNRVIVLDNLSENLYDAEIKALVDKYQLELRIYNTDAALPRDWPQADEIYHLAEGVATARIQADGYDLIERSIAMMQNMMYSYNTTPVKILYVSSTEALGNASKDIPLDETDTIGWTDAFNPRNCYGFAKFACEQMLTHFSKRTLFKYNIVRLGTVYGERMKRNSNVKSLIDRLLKEEKPLRVIDPADSESYLYVSDAVSGLVAIMESDLNKQTLNLTANEEVIVSDLAVRLADLSGLGGNNIEIVTEDNYKPVRKLFSSVKIRVLTKWDEKVSLDEGLKKTWDYFKSL